MKRGREEEEFDENDIEKFINACDMGNMDIVKDFIKRGIDVNVKDCHKRTALQFASLRGRVDLSLIHI